MCLGQLNHVRLFKEPAGAMHVWHSIAMCVLSFCYLGEEAGTGGRTDLFTAITMTFPPYARYQLSSMESTECFSWIQMRFTETDVSLLGLLLCSEFQTDIIRNPWIVFDIFPFV